MPILTGQQLGKELMTALGLPNNTTWLEIRCAVGEPVIVKCGYYPDVIDADTLVEKLAEYELHEKAPNA